LFAGIGNVLASLSMIARKKKMPKSLCCNKKIVWLNCDECEQAGENHAFAICPKCKKDVED